MHLIYTMGIEKNGYYTILFLYKFIFLYLVIKKAPIGASFSNIHHQNWIIKGLQVLSISMNYHRRKSCQVGQYIIIRIQQQLLLINLNLQRMNCIHIQNFLKGYLVLTYGYPLFNVEKPLVSLNYSYARVYKYVTSKKFFSNILSSSFSDSSLYFFTIFKCSLFFLSLDILSIMLSTDLIL